MNYLRQSTALLVKPLICAALTLFLFSTTSCKNQRQASASVPPSATPSLFPEEGGGAVNEEEAIPPLVGYTPDSIPAESSTPKPAPKPAPKPFALRSNEKLVNHKAVSGDNLWKLAKEYGTTVSRIKSANGLSSEVIYRDKVYKIPTVNGRVETNLTSTPKPEPRVSPATASPSISRTSAPPAPAPRISPAPTTGYTLPTPKPISSISPSGSSSEPKTFPMPTGPANSGNSSFPRPTFGSGNY